MIPMGLKSIPTDRKKITINVSLSGVEVIRTFFRRAVWPADIPAIKAPRAIDVPNSKEAPVAITNVTARIAKRKSS